MAGPFKMKGWSPFHQEEEKLVPRAKTPKEAKFSGYTQDGETHAFRSDLTFDKAFRTARNAGVKTFYWKGGKKTTEVK